LSCQVTSIMLPSREPVDTTVACIVLADDRHYLHSFERYVRNVHEHGAAYGTFLCDPGKVPNRYRGGVIVLNSNAGHNRMQIGEKLTDQEVSEFQEKYGKDRWRQRALQDPEWVTTRWTSLR